LMMLVTGWLYAGYGSGAFYAMILLSAAGGAVALWLAGLTRSAAD